MTKRSLGARTLAPALPVWLVGTYDDAERPNVMTASWAGICCSKPPCLAVSLRKATYTYGSLVARRAFTVSVPSESLVREADWVGKASGRDVAKFETAGLTPVRSELVDAPWVDECPLVLECRLAGHHELGLHTLFVGEILDVKVDEDALDEKGRARPEILRPVLFTPDARVYHGLGESIGRAFSIGDGIGRA
jgi:flavin reductase (DIM6/NTAB) family NADH-FMN oxidoreductase RutF